MGKDPKRRSKRAAAADISEAKSDNTEQGSSLGEASSEAHAEFAPASPGSQEQPDGGRGGAPSRGKRSDSSAAYLNPAGSWGLDSNAQRSEPGVLSPSSSRSADHRGSNSHLAAWQNDLLGRSQALRGGKGPKDAEVNQAATPQWQSWSGGSTGRGWG